MVMVWHFYSHTHISISMFLQLAKCLEEMVFSKARIPVLQSPVQSSPRPRRYVKIIANMQTPQPVRDPPMSPSWGLMPADLPNQYISEQNRRKTHSPTPRVMHIPFHNRHLYQALSISYPLTTSAQRAHAYSQTLPQSPNSNNASLTLSSPSLLPSRFSSLVLSYNTLSTDRTSPSVP